MSGPGQTTTEPCCSACGSALDSMVLFRGVDRLHRTQGVFEVRCCATCGAGVTFPFATPADLASYYPEAYGPYDDALGAVAGTISRAVRRSQGRRALTSPPLSALDGVPVGRAVDVGCGRGDVASLFVQRGWQVTGIDPSEGACRAARARGIDARQGTLADVPLEEGAYDAAIFQHSLEHTPDPVGDLMKVRIVLRPGGLVLISVPNFASWQRHRFEDRWYHLDLPRHRTHFTSQGLEAVLARAGLVAESITTSTSTVGLPATIQYVIAGRCLFPSGLSLRVAAGLCVLALPLGWALDRFGGGGDQLHAVARRLA
jgi:SAM-dependent methyltransferase